ncbi:hypothetical protein [Phyllobacterium sophorae]|uniref:Uncharacterized protein n=1 Tax=Phyllobacterium sophorae TaxID=1520277 RepID=A0A2P7BDW3_9HYPH|nr:hypothetical protein [Phyllobacterium sophorae]PSH64666.1 hypothetical protein CU103_12345 [Phyllobacterium sophorae]
MHVLSYKGLGNMALGVKEFSGEFFQSDAPIDPNLMAPLSWVAGADTTLSIAGGRARATIGAGSNPRIWKQVAGLTNGATYKLNGRMYVGTCSTVRLRITPDTGLPNGSIYELIDSVDHLFTEQTFVMSGTAMFIGIVGISGAAGQYVEIDDNFSLTLV